MGARGGAQARLFGLRTEAPEPRGGSGRPTPSSASAFRALPAWARAAATTGRGGTRPRAHARRASAARAARTRRSARGGAPGFARLLGLSGRAVGHGPGWVCEKPGRGARPEGWVGGHGAGPRGRGPVGSLFPRCCREPATCVPPNYSAPSSTTMGRKLDPTKEKRGPGRKARKQKGAETELARFLPAGRAPHQRPAPTPCRRTLPGGRCRRGAAGEVCRGRDVRRGTSACARRGVLGRREFVSCRICEVIKLGLENGNTSVSGSWEWDRPVTWWEGWRWESVV